MNYNKISKLPVLFVAALFFSLPALGSSFLYVSDSHALIKSDSIHDIHYQLKSSNVEMTPEIVELLDTALEVSPYHSESVDGRVFEEHPEVGVEVGVTSLPFSIKRIIGKEIREIFGFFRNNNSEASALLTLVDLNSFKVKILTASGEIQEGLNFDQISSSLEGKDVDRLNSERFLRKISLMLKNENVSDYTIAALNIHLESRDYTAWTELFFELAAQQDISELAEEFVSNTQNEDQSPLNKMAKLIEESISVLEASEEAAE